MAVVRGGGYDREDEPRDEDKGVGEQAHGDWLSVKYKRRPATNSVIL